MFRRWAANRRHMGTGRLAVRMFSPKTARRDAASSSESPFRLVPSSAYAFSTGRLHSSNGSTLTTSGASTWSIPIVTPRTRFYTPRRCPAKGLGTLLFTGADGAIGLNRQWSASGRAAIKRYTDGVVAAVGTDAVSADAGRTRHD